MKETDRPAVVQGGAPVALGLGANLEEPVRAIAAAVEALRRGGVGDLRVAPFYRTTAVDCEPGTADFVNTVVVGRWRGSPLALLALCQAVETALGRPACHSSRLARAIDVDILLIGEHCLESAALTVPHPRLSRRLFVLVPLAEIAPEWRIPPTLESVASCRDRLLAAAGGQAWGKRL